MPPDTAAWGDAPALRQRALRIHSALLEHYGEPELKTRRDPLSELVLTILSQNTADVNTARAYARLRERFPTWEAVADAPVADVAEAIQPAGLSNVKAPRIQAILQGIEERHGALSLDFLGDMDVAAARNYLTGLHGVGPKTAACVLLFSLHMPALPVDTHVHRVSQRLGLVPAKASAERAHELLEELIPQALYYPFHLLFIQHGRTICKAQRPACPRCPVSAECEYYHTVYLPEHPEAP